MVRVGDLTQELDVDVPRSGRERPGVGERIAAQERDQDRSHSEDVARRRRRVELVQRGVVRLPEEANGAMSAPVDTPVTILKTGRRPVADQPARNPAPNAPFAPPPDSARCG